MCIRDRSSTVKYYTQTLVSHRKSRLAWDEFKLIIYCSRNNYMPATLFIIIKNIWTFAIHMNLVQSACSNQHSERYYSMYGYSDLKAIYRIYFWIVMETNTIQKLVIEHKSPIQMCMKPSVQYITQKSCTFMYRKQRSRCFTLYSHSLLGNLQTFIYPNTCLLYTSRCV